MLVRDLAGALPGSGARPRVRRRSADRTRARGATRSPMRSVSTCRRRCWKPRPSAFVTTCACRFVTHDLDDPLPFDPGSFDAVITSLAVHHVERRSQARPLRGDRRPAPARWCVRQPRDRRQPDPGAARPVARRDGRPRRPERPAPRHEQPARLDRRSRPRAGRLHLEVAEPGPAPGRASARLTPPAVQRVGSSETARFGTFQQRVGQGDRELGRVGGPRRIAFVELHDLRPAPQEVRGGPVRQPIRLQRVRALVRPPVDPGRNGAATWRPMRSRSSPRRSRRPGRARACAPRRSAGRRRTASVQSMTTWCHVPSGLSLKMFNGWKSP